MQGLKLVASPCFVQKLAVRRSAVCAVRAVRFFCLFIAAAALVLPSAQASGSSVAFLGQLSSIVHEASGSPRGVATDSSGNVYFADTANGAVYMETRSGSGYTQSTVATGLSSPSAVAVDAHGVVYIADSGNNRVLEETPGSGGSFTQTVLFGTGTSYPVGTPTGLSVGSSGYEVWIADSVGNRVVHLVGSGTNWISQTPFNASSNGLSNPTSIFEDKSSNVYIADTGNNRILKETWVSGATYSQSVVYSTGLSSPSGVAVDANGAIFIADTGNNQILKAVPNGSSYDTAVLVASGLGVVAPYQLAVDGSDNLYIADSGQMDVVEFQAYDASFGRVVVGNSVSLALPFTVSAGTEVDAIRILTQGATGAEYTAQNPDTSTSLCTVGTYSSTTTCTVDVTFKPGSLAAFPGAVVFMGPSSTVLATTYLYGSGGGGQIAFLPGIINTVAGNGTQGTGGNGVSATSVGISAPIGAALDASGNLYFSTASDGRVWKVSSGQLYLVAGKGTASYSGDNGPATSAGLAAPAGLAVDGAGNVYIADGTRVRRVDAVSGIITTYAGNGTYGTTGDGGPATSAELREAVGLALDPQGNLYISDDRFPTIRKVDASTGIITAYAGNGNSCSNASSACGDGQLATTASLNTPGGLATDTAGNLYIVDAGLSKVHEVNAISGIINIVAGNAYSCYGATDGIVATQESLCAVSGIAIDGGNNLYLTENDSKGGYVQEILAGTGLVYQMAGSGIYSPGNGGPATSAAMSTVKGIAVDGSGNLYVSDFHSMQEVSSSATALNLGYTSNGVSSAPLPVMVTNMGTAPVSAVSAGLSVSSSFSQVTGSGTLTDCSATFSLASGHACNISIAFSPVSPDSATVTGSVVFTDDALNASPSTTQTISLTGFSMGDGYSAINSGGAGIISNPYLLFGVDPAPSIVSGGNAGSGVAVQEFRSGTTLLLNTASTDTVTLKVTGPGGYSKTYTAAVSGGAATFDLSGAALTTLGTYTYTATVSGVVTAVQTESVVPPDFSTAVGTASASQTAAVMLPKGGTIGSIDVLTQGIPNYEFNPAAGGTCAVNATFSAGQSCTVNYTLTPKHPGRRMGAVVLKDSGGNELGTAYISGVGTPTPTGLTPGNINTVAGTGTAAYNGDGMAATSANIGPSGQIVFDAAGNMYFADRANNRVRKVDAATGTISTIAGNGTVGNTGDNGPAVNAELYAPGDVALDGAGNIYIGTTSGLVSLIRKVDASSGIITTVAGNGLDLSAGGEHFVSGDGGPATSAALIGGNAIAVDGAGNLYFPSSGNENAGGLRKVDAATGIITTVLGGRGNCYGGVSQCGDGGPIAQAAVSISSPPVFDTAGNLYFFNNNRVRKVNWSTGLITKVAGGSGTTDSGDGQAAIYAGISASSSVAVDAAGDIFIGETGTLGPGAICCVGGARVRMVVGSTGKIWTIAGNGTGTFSGDGGPAVNAGVPGPYGLGVDPSGNLYINDTYLRIRKVNFTAGGSGPSIPVAKIAFEAPPAPLVLQGGNAGSNIEVGELDSSNSVVLTGNDTITLTVTGPNGYSATYTAKAVSGIATYNLSSVPLNTTGSYTYTATLNALSAVASESVAVPTMKLAFGTPPAPAISIGGNPGSAVTVNVEDLSGNILTSNTDNISLCLIGPGSSGSKCFSAKAVAGVATFDLSSAILTNGGVYTFSAYDTAGTSQPISATETVSGGTVFSFPNLPVHTPSPVEPVSVTLPNGGTPQSILVLTDGQQNGAFTASSGGTCATGTNYSGGASCTVDVVFTPPYPIPYHGAIVLLDGSGNVIGTEYLSGMGYGPELVFEPPVQTTVVSSLQAPSGLAVDTNFNLLYTDQGSNGLYKTPWNGSSYGTPVAISTSLNAPYEVAVDGAGNVYVADSGDSFVYKFVWNGTAYQSPVQLGSGLSGPKGVAIDNSGDLFIADTGNNRIVELPWNGTGYDAQTTIASSVASVGQLAFDPYGILYATLGSGGAVVRSFLYNGSYSTPTTVESGFSNPASVLLDTNSNLYVSDAGAGNVFSYARNNMGQYGSQATLASSLNAPSAVALDPAGNFFIADTGDGKIIELGRNTSPSLAFATTTVGATSADSPKTVTLANIGNGPLAFSVPASGSNPSFGAGFQDDSASTCSSVAAGGMPVAMANNTTCTLAIDFVPIAKGADSASVLLTDNNLNINPSTQSIALSGTGTAGVDPTRTSTSATLSLLVNGQTQTLTATVTDKASPSTIPAGTVTFSDTYGTTTNTIGPFTLNGAGVASTTYTPAPGTHLVTSVFTPADPGAFASSSDTTGATFTVAPYGAAVSFTVTPQNTTTTVGIPDNLTITAYDAYGNEVGNFNGTATLTSTDSRASFGSGTVTFTNGVATSTATFATGGTQTVTATSGSIIGTSPNITVNASPGTVSGPQNVHFNPTPVGGPEITVPVTVGVGSGVDIGSITVVTQGATGLDFTNNTSQTTCVTGTSSGASNCTVSVNFKPTLPGPRQGAIVVRDPSGNILSITYLDGNGVAPAVAFTPAVITTIAGNGTAGNSGDNGPTASAELNGPDGSVLDAAGNLYVADYGASVVREISPTGVITTVAGTGTGGYNGDGIAATSAKLGAPTSVAIDGAGNLYIADQSNARVRMVDPVTGKIATVAGIGTPGYSGDGQAATSAAIVPYAIAIDGHGNLYVSDQDYHVVREVSAATGVITTVAGNGTASYTGDNGPATAATLNTPNGVSLDQAGNLYIADAGNNVIRKVDASSGVISTVAGNGTPGYTGDGQSAAHAEFSFPNRIFVDAGGDLYISDVNNNAIREVSGTTGIVTTIAGNGAAGSSGDGGPATGAQLRTAYGLFVDALGNLYIGDMGNHRVRKVTVANTPALNFPTATYQGSTDVTDGTQTVVVTNVGNASLDFPIPATGTNASIAAGFRQNAAETCPDLTGSSSPASIGAGVNCTYGVDFVPAVVGANSGSLVLTDNALNVTGATQFVGLSGTGLQPVYQLAFTVAPAPSIAAGGNAGSAVTVSEEDSTGAIMSGTADLITLTVTGPNGYQQTYTATAVNGVATFNLGSDILTGAGGYTYTATIANPTTNPATAPETVNSGIAAKVSASAGSGQSTVIGTAFAIPLQVTVTDAYSNPLSGQTVTFGAPASGPTASLSAGGTARTDNNGQATVTATANGLAGTSAYSVTASANGVTATASFLLTNTPATPIVTVAATPVSLAYGQRVQLAMTFSPANIDGTTPVNGVLAYDNSNLLNAYLVDASGDATTSLLPAVGQHTYSVFYSNLNDPNFGKSATAYSSQVTVNKASTTLKGPSTQPVLVVNQTTGAVSVTVTGQYSGPGIDPPSGPVTYTITDGSSAIVATGPVTIVNGAVSIPVASTLAPGLYTITVSYPGDGNYTGSSTTVPLQVGQIVPTLNWPSPSPISYGTTLNGTLDAVAMNGSATVPGTYVYTATPNGGSTGAAGNSTVLPAGTYTLGVTFTPTDTTTYKTATGTVTLVVNPVTPMVVLGSSANPILLLNPVTFTATVSSSIRMPTGSITFYDGTTLLGHAPLTNGSAALTISSLSLGTHPVTAVYSGDTNFVTLTSNAVNEVVEDFNLSISTAAGSVTSITVQPGKTATYLLVVGPAPPATIFPAVIQLSASGLPPGATYTLTPNSLPAGSGNTNVTLVVNTPASSLAQNHPSNTGLPGKTAFGSGLALALLLLPFTRRMRRMSKRLRRAVSLVVLLMAGAAAMTGLSGCNSYPTGFFGQTPQTYTIAVTGTSGPLAHSTSVTLTIE